MKRRAILLPGNGGASPRKDHWFPWLINELEKLNFQVIAREMPDAKLAHMHIWLPFIEQELKPDENCLIIGHSSGAVATMRYLETHRVWGAALVGVNHTDLGLLEEIEAEWYDKPWQWSKIQQNASWIAQFDSTNDPYIPIEEPRFIRDKLQTEYFEFKNRGHFTGWSNRKFPELIEVITKKMNA